jgi:hypothetical protein
MTIQLPRVRTKTYSDKRFDKTASTFWNNLPSETQNEQFLEIFKKIVKIIFLELLIMILRKLTTLTVLHVFQESLNLH